MQQKYTKIVECI